ncbi:hypothetical protein EJB05_50445, partial [Eragrostis curvula]
MELAPWSSVLGAVLATALFVVTVLGRRSGTRKKYNLPPGPRPWPVIGNMNLIGPLPHRSIHELSKRYGPLMSLRFGSFPVVVASSVDAAAFFLKTNDPVFIDRPETAAGRHTFYNSSNMLWAPYGEYWRQGRKLYQTELLSPKQLRLHEHVRREEVRAMLRGVHDAAAESKGASVSLRDHLFMLSLGVISRMLLGKKYVGVEIGDTATAEEFSWMLSELLFLNGALHVGDLIPWLDRLDPQGYIRRMKRLSERLDRFLEHVLDEHNERRRREGEEAFVANDVVDQLLQLADDPSLKVPIKRDDVKAMILDLLVAGTDTSSVTVEWAMSELLRNPEALATAADELDRVVGRGRLVAEEDVPSLPYVEAVVKETMRLHLVSPLLSPRLSREDTSFAGYDIPAGTRVHVNVWAIGRDPRVWGDEQPEEFRPERFAGSSVDVKGKDMELLPFGSGRRMCPGYGLGLKMVQFALASLLHAFAWRLPDGVAAEDLDMEETFRISMPRKVPLQAVAQPRLPAHLYTTQL